MPFRHRHGGSPPRGRSSLCRHAWLAAPAAALAGCDRTPLSALNPASEQAGHIADIWQAMAWGSLSVLLMMLALVFLAIRARSSGRPGRRPLWLLLGGGVLFPLSVMAALLAYAYLAAPAQGEPAYRVQVTGHRWWWEVRYPDAPGAARYSANVLHVPRGVPVLIELSASDVIHGFWVPRLGGKMDAVPGRLNKLVYTAEEAGVYQGQCAEYCGIGHAAMPFQVVAHNEAELSRVLDSLPTHSQGSP
ncbi:cytochrome c oxidase subunit II [Pusillimonas sp.]|uniref:cytochrome c oxidase subunit II n=1 Tax=Pusillimonas sp. TaxID=3040095 RepID=UPI0029AEED96|nr:cytochrome c oxidase subunit II [Pusillimonas sp.]MDX3893250.1 cytochrome c oxidase subunit II [Pusillimonas sp.]